MLPCDTYSNIEKKVFVATLSNYDSKADSDSYTLLIVRLEMFCQFLDVNKQASPLPL